MAKQPLKLCVQKLVRHLKNGPGSSSERCGDSEDGQVVGPDGAGASEILLSLRSLPTPALPKSWTQGGEGCACLPQVKPTQPGDQSWHLSSCWGSPGFLT